MSDPLAVAATVGLPITLLFATFAFGLRHGIDWDHIAAITDITSTQDDVRGSMRLATLYALGHGAVVLLLGLLAIEFGTHLPMQIDVLMERFVGLTLVVLGIYVFYALVRYKRDFRMRSRWMLVFSVLRRGMSAIRAWRSPSPPVVAIEHDHEHSHEDSLHKGHDHPEVLAELEPGRAKLATMRQHQHRHRHEGTMPADPFMSYGKATSFGVGMIHGIGAETPTQVLLFVAAAGAGGRIAGAVLLATFLVGLLASNTLIAVASTYGFLEAGRNFRLYAAVAVLTGSFSLAVGVLFLLGLGDVLPPILGG
jgi:hypothetical protein